VGVVAYELKLPKGSMLHPVFHVSQLKKCIGNHINPNMSLPIVSNEGKIRVESVAILDRRLVKKNNEARTEILVKWSNLDDDEATWEDYLSLCEQFPEIKLEDKLKKKKGALSRSEVEEGICNRLGAVRVSFEFKRDSGAETGFSREINGGSPVRNGAQK
jgi:Chromo (CHRromatin Organisation MOdifier) domain